eukprot:9086008-Lingulodinium_polyedra.AAC.1
MLDLRQWIIQWAERLQAQQGAWGDQQGASPEERAAALAMKGMRGRAPQGTVRELANWLRRHIEVGVERG